MRVRKRFILIGLLFAVLLLAGCGGPSEEAGSTDECELENPPLYEKGELTVATDKPAYPPWFKGNPKNYSGYEGDVASEIAERMDLPIKWTVEPFNKSYAPGAKDFDFDINEITITPEREKVVDFSNGYFDNAQGVLVMKDGPAADAKSALESGQIDVFVTDLVTTVYLRDVEIDGSTVIGKYPRNEQFGMLFEEGNPLVGCVNEVLGEMKSDGTLEELQKKHLQQYLDVPTLKK